MRNSFLLLILLPALSVQALEVKTEDFVFCAYKKAIDVEARTVRIHRFSKENKCAVIYSANGKDNMVSYGRWLSFCKNKMERVIANLQKSLWQCEKQRQSVFVFYSF